jgi:hypothetical protein
MLWVENMPWIWARMACCPLLAWIANYILPWSCSRSYAFVLFRSITESWAALEVLRVCKIEGSSIYVNFPRSLITHFALHAWIRSHIRCPPGFGYRSPFMMHVIWISIAHETDYHLMLKFIHVMEMLDVKGVWYMDLNIFLGGDFLWHPSHPVGGHVTPCSSLGSLGCPHKPTLVFMVHFVLAHVHPGRTSRSVTHTQIALGQACLTQGSFWVSFRKRRYTLLRWV